MEEFKQFVISKIGGNGPSMLGGAILLPVASAAFFIWFFNSGLEVIVMPRIVIAAFVFAPIISPYLLYLWWRARSPQKSGFYKLLFETPEKIVSYKLQKAGIRYNIVLNKSKGMPATLINLKREDLEKFAEFMNINFPNIKNVL